MIRLPIWLPAGLVVLLCILGVSPAPFDGLHHVYVNDTGSSAARSGEPYPDDTLLVFDLFASLLAEHAHVAGPRKFTAVRVKGATAECFGCHAARKPTDCVFARCGEG